MKGTNPFFFAPSLPNACFASVSVTLWLSLSAADSLPASVLWDLRNGNRTPWGQRPPWLLDLLWAPLECAPLLVLGLVLLGLVLLLLWPVPSLPLSEALRVLRWLLPP